MFFVKTKHVDDVRGEIQESISFYWHGIFEYNLTKFIHRKIEDTRMKKYVFQFSSNPVR